jgi:hypothetical protein
MATGQLILIQFLSESEEEFCSLFFYPLTTIVYLIPGFKNKNPGKIFIFRKGFISPVNNFFTHSPPDET